MKKKGGMVSVSHRASESQGLFIPFPRALLPLLIGMDLPELARGQSLLHFVPAHVLVHLQVAPP